MEYGITYEPTARTSYFKYLSELHNDFHLDLAGFCISTEKAEFGASPDGLVTCSCCAGHGCLEIKCPYRMREMSIEDFSKLNGSFLLQSDDGFNLDRNHDYFFQVQLQMFCSETSYCDFVVWSKKSIFIERIYRDDDFLKFNLEKASIFYKKVIVPELLSRYYTDSKEVAAAIEAWCFCCKPQGDKDMIKCSNDLCPIQWFHEDCVDTYYLSEDEDWYCSTCSSMLACETAEDMDYMEWEDSE